MHVLYIASVSRSFGIPAVLCPSCREILLVFFHTVFRLLLLKRFEAYVRVLTQFPRSVGSSCVCASPLFPDTCSICIHVSFSSDPPGARLCPLSSFCLSSFVALSVCGSWLPFLFISWSFFKYPTCCVLTTVLLWFSLFMTAVVAFSSFSASATPTSPRYRELSARVNGNSCSTRGVPATTPSTTKPYSRCVDVLAAYEPATQPSSFCSSSYKRPESGDWMDGWIQLVLSLCLQGFCVLALNRVVVFTGWAGRFACQRARTSCPAP